MLQLASIHNNIAPAAPVESPFPETPPNCFHAVRPLSAKHSGYNKTFFSHLVKLLDATPMLHLRICRSFSDTKYMNGHAVVVLISTNYQIITKPFLRKLSFS